MLDFQQKRKIKSLMYNRITICVLGVLALFFLHSTWSVYKKKVESEDMKALTSLRVDELRARDAELKNKIAKLDTEAGLEEEIRSKFSVAKENEAMVIVIDDENQKSSSTAAKSGFWGKVKGFFTSKPPTRE